MVKTPPLSVDNLNAEQQQTESTLAIMQADIDKALQARRQDESLTETEMIADKSDDLLSNSADLTDSTVFDAPTLSRVIEMAWEDRTPFGAIERSYGLNEAGVIKLMRQELKPSSFRLWRKRVTGRNTKHQAKRSFDVGRAYCKTQYKLR